MRSVILIAAIVMATLGACGDDTTATATAPADLAVVPTDCAHVVSCSCQDGTCQMRSGCSPSTCNDACAAHGGVNVDNVCAMDMARGD